MIYKERPIIMTTPMQKANLKGDKPQTRRTRGLNIINVRPHAWSLDSGREYFIKDGIAYARLIDITGLGKDPDILGPKRKDIKCPYGKPGDLLWVKESASFFQQLGGFIQREKTLYKADEKNDNNTLIKWKPSIFMPKAIARTWLMIRDIRLERLQDISESDAKQEGIEKHFYPKGKDYVYLFYPCNDLRDGTYVDLPILSYISLWRSLVNKLKKQERNLYSWEHNPWVWVVKYKVISNTGRPDNSVIEYYRNQILKQNERVRV